MEVLYHKLLYVLLLEWKVLIQTVKHNVINNQ